MERESGQARGGGMGWRWKVDMDMIEFNSLSGFFFFNYADPHDGSDGCSFPLRNDTQHTPYTAMAAVLNVERLNALFVPSANSKQWRRANGRRGPHEHDSGLFLCLFSFSLFPVRFLFSLFISSSFWF